MTNTAAIPTTRCLHLAPTLPHRDLALRVLASRVGPGAIAAPVITRLSAVVTLTAAYVCSRPRLRRVAQTSIREHRIELARPWS